MDRLNLQPYRRRPIKRLADFIGDAFVALAVGVCVFMTLITLSSIVAHLFN